MSHHNLLEPIPPGEILREDFMEPLGISINHLARNIGGPPNRISEIVNGKRAVTADSALRLQRFFGVEAQFWLNLQSVSYYSTSLLPAPNGPSGPCRWS